MQKQNLFLFFVLTFLILISWGFVAHYLAPQPKPESADVAATKEADKKAEEKKAAENKADEKKKPAEKKGEKKPEPAVVAAAESHKPTPWDKLIELGEKDQHSRFHLYTLLDPYGAGVRSVRFNKFQAADYLGRPEWLNEEKTQPVPLELVPGPANEQTPSFLLYGYDVNDPTDDKPLDTLGRIDWEPGEKKTETLADGRRRQSVTFRAEAQKAVVITKTFSLTEGEYHLGLEVRIHRKEGADKNLKFRYQVTGAKGLPVEGKWYTSIFRNALIARVKKDGDVDRDLQDLRQISNWRGGNEILKKDDFRILYAMVANQYFASGIVVDNAQKQTDFLRQARPTLETAMTRGVVKSIAEDGSSFVLKPEKDPDITFQVPPDAVPDVRLLQKGSRIAVLHHTASYTGKEHPEIATAFFAEDAIPALWMEDITVRVATDPIELKGDAEVVHKYLLYNGPVKVNQLFPPAGLALKPLEEGGVPAELYQRYHDDLHLNTLTDYHSPGAMGTFAKTIYWTDIVIKCTNLMHTVLGYLHAIIPSYGLCIIVLTVLVRGMMFPLSRKQALMSVRMQQLAPELKKLQEKHKDDRQALGLAQMELYRKHGVNPFGSCWVLLLQMPIFMGLYFALQESIHFRLAEFWPTWITNLAAPDMLFSWSQSIPYISRVQDYGSFFYLGPYFNLLPVIAVALMIVQQKMMTPPPTDEQQAMQQKMMKYMMIFFGLMFYKVAAGLCVYFITSSVWGFCERKLLPKKKPDVSEPTLPADESYFQKLLRKVQGEHVTTAAPTGVTTAGGVTTALETRVRSGGKRGRSKRRQGQVGNPETDAAEGSMLARWRKRLRDWWVTVLKEAEKKNRG